MAIYSSEEICVICGAPVPEGRMVCEICEEQIKRDIEEDEALSKK